MKTTNRRLAAYWRTLSTSNRAWLILGFALLSPLIIPLGIGAICAKCVSAIIKAVGAVILPGV